MMNAIEAVQIVKEMVKQSRGDELIDRIDKFMAELQQNGSVREFGLEREEPRDVALRLTLGSLYDDKVAPLLNKAMHICGGESIPFIATVHVPRLIRGTIQLVGYNWRSFH